MSNNINYINPEEMFSIQREACTAHEILCKSFVWNGSYIYPEDFGGTYIDYDTLHILIKRNGDTHKYQNLLSNFNKIAYDYVNYSYNELFALAKKISSEKSLRSGVIAYGVDVISNSALIQVIPDYYDAAMCSCRDAHNILVEIRDKRVQSEVSLVGGSSISSNGFSITLGGSGTYNQAVAFLTCGHDMTVGGSLISGNLTVGTLSQVQYANNASGDYSFATAASGYTASSYVLTTNGNTLKYGGYLTNPAVGTYLYKYGNVSGQAYCKVTETGISVLADKSIYIKNMTVAIIESGTTAKGDSGGPYRNGNYFCGIHHGSNTSTSVTYVYFTPYVEPYNAGFRISVN